MPLDLRYFKESVVEQGRQKAQWDYSEKVPKNEDGKWVIFPQGVTGAVVSISFPDGSGEATIETCHNTYYDIRYNDIDDMKLEWTARAVNETLFGTRDTCFVDILTKIPTAIRLVNLSLDKSAYYTVRST